MVRNTCKSCQFQTSQDDVFPACNIVWVSDRKRLLEIIGTVVKTAPEETSKQPHSREKNN